VVAGMGKSGLIANKIVASMNSLGILSCSLHPCDALHGDLGMFRPADIFIMISASGRSPELSQLLPHLPRHIPRICLTCTADSPLAAECSAVLLADLPKALTEREIYGVPAPTTSTTVCLALGDALCISLAEILTADNEQRKSNFIRSHPGGAIGMSKDLVGDIMIPWDEVAQVDVDADELEILRAAAGRRWICLGNERLIRGQELAKSSKITSLLGRRLDSITRVGSHEEVSLLPSDDVILVVGGMSTILGIYECNS